MKENKEIEAVVSDVDKNGTKTFEVKKEKIYKRKDLITTAIIAFLVGAIIATGGFAISKALSKGKGNKDFRTNGIHRNIEEKNINNEQKQNRSSNKMNNSNANKKNNRQNIPNINNNSKNNNQNNQNPPSLPNNEQQPNNSNSSQNVPNNNQNSTSNKS